MMVSVEPATEPSASEGVGVASWCGAIAMAPEPPSALEPAAELAEAKAATRDTSRMEKRIGLDALCMQARSISPRLLAMFITNVRLRFFCSIMRPRAKKRVPELVDRHERRDD